ELWLVLEKVRTEPPPSIEPRVNRELEAICLKCLEKSPERRYASAAALADDLQRFLDGYATLGRPGLSQAGQSSGIEGAGPQDALSTRYDLASPRQADPHKTKSWWQFWK